MIRFCRFDLRTTDADAARAFYGKVLGHDRASVWPLHEEALARGAKPHWLGQLGVTDPDAVAEAFVVRGAVRLGPTRPTADGGRAAVLRDPGGALLAVGTQPPPAPEAAPSLSVLFHVLHTRDAAQALTNYRDLFGWEPTDRVDLGARGSFQNVTWGGARETSGETSGETVAAVGDVAETPGIHPQWLHFLEVPSLDRALDAVRASGGVPLEPLTRTNGDRVCACNDPQGAAFGLYERAKAR